MLHAVQEAGFVWQTTPEVSFLEPAVLQGCPRLRCAFTLRHAGASGGALNLSMDLGQPAEVLANRHKVLCALGLGHTSLYTVRQVHGNHVCVVDAMAVRQGLQGVQADALITTLPEVPLGVLVADCLPIVLYTLDPPVLAVVHAGRMGTYHRIASRVLDILYARFAVTAEQVYAVLGPAIGACCYTLDARAVSPFRERFPDWQAYFRPGGVERWVMHLTAANTAQLHAAGVPATHVLTVPLCTSCYKQHLYSHRAEGREAGRGMAIAALLPG
jgi:hypothetical protein